MAQPPQRQDDDPARDPKVAPAAPARGAGRDRPIRLLVPVPPIVRAVLTNAQLDPSEEMHRVIDALFRKLTPERGPAEKGPYAGEVRYFERVNESPEEVRTLAEDTFVLLNRAHEALLQLMQAKQGSEQVTREVQELSAGLAELVDAAQEVARRDRGGGAAEFEWKVTES